MLVFQRRPDETFRIGHHIIQILGIRGQNVRVGVLSDDKEIVIRTELLPDPDRPGKNRESTDMRPVSNEIIERERQKLAAKRERKAKGQGNRQGSY